MKQTDSLTDGSQIRQTPTYLAMYWMRRQFPQAIKCNDPTSSCNKENKQAQVLAPSQCYSMSIWIKTCCNHKDFELECGEQFAGACAEKLRAARLGDAALTCQQTKGLVSREGWMDGRYHPQMKKNRNMFTLWTREKTTPIAERLIL